MGPQQRKVLLFKDLGEEGYLDETSRPRARQEGKRGVVKVPSLLFDIELEESAAEDKQQEEDTQDVLRQLKALLQPWNMVELKLQHQVRKAYAEAAEEKVELDSHRLASRLDLPGYTFKVRTALGGGWSGDCLRQLRHYFLTCIAPGTSGGVSYVIDPCFKEQFEIANPTPQYSSLLAELPCEFIGTEDRICTIVTILSNEIRRSFQTTGATLPPWRHPASMLSKWRPRRSEDITVAPAKPILSTSSAVPVLSTERGVGKEHAPEVKIAARNSFDDVAMTMAEMGGPGKFGVYVSNKVSSPPLLEGPHSAGKRGRGTGISNGSSKCSSLLASKLRGVSHFNAKASASDLYKSSGVRSRA